MTECAPLCFRSRYVDNGIPDAVSNLDDLTQPASDERGYKVLKFLAKALSQFLPPGASGTASELFDLLVSDPAVKRRDLFVMDLAARLEKLAENAIFDPASLIGNDDVSAFLLHAVQIAVRTRGVEKLEALREVAARGTIANDEDERAPAYVAMGIIDRLTDYHIIRLRWEVKPGRSYTYGQIKAGNFQSLHFGQPTFADPSLLKHPTIVFNFEGVVRYVEQQSVLNFRLAYADLAAMGLLTAIPEQEVYVENHRQKHRPTGKIAGYAPSELGKFVVQYIEPIDSIANKPSI